MTIMELGNKIKEYKELKVYLEEVQAECDALADEIKREMEHQNKEEVKTDLFKATYKPVESTRFDSKRFKADNPTEYTKYAKVTVSKRFIVS